MIQLASCWHFHSAHYKTQQSNKQPSWSSQMMWQLFADMHCIVQFPFWALQGVLLYYRPSKAEKDDRGYMIADMRRMRIYLWWMIIGLNNRKQEAGLVVGLLRVAHAQRRPKIQSQVETPSPEIRKWWQRTKTTTTTKNNNNKEQQQ